MSTLFLNDRIEELYDRYQERKISHQEFASKFNILIGTFLSKEHSIKNLKRMVNSINLASDNIKKKYGYTRVKRVKFEEVYKEIFS